MADDAPHAVTQMQNDVLAGTPRRLSHAADARAQAREANEVAAEADRLADLARQLRKKARQAQEAAKRLPGDVKARFPTGPNELRHCNFPRKKPRGMARHVSAAPSCAPVRH